MELQTLLLRRLKKSVNYRHIYSDIELRFIVDEIKRINDSGSSFTKISKKYNIDRSTIRKLFKTFGHNVINWQNQLRVREDLFETVATEEDAYWLGFIYADGYISDEGKFELSLKSTDSDHLIKFANYCKFDTSKVILKQKVGSYHRCRVGFATQHIQKNFNRLGIVPRKSLIITFPKFLSDELVRHFIRGYFDGDGCISIRKKRKPTHKSTDFTTSILGTKNLLTTLNRLCPINMKNIHKRNNIYTLSFHTREAHKFMRYMYNNSTIYLTRKYNKYTNKIAPLYSDI